MFIIQTTEKIALIPAKRAAKKLGISSRRLRVLAKEGRVKGAVYDVKKGWSFPKDEIIIRPGARGPQLSFSKQAVDGNIYSLSKKA